MSNHSLTHRQTHVFAHRKSTGWQPVPLSNLTGESPVPLNPKSAIPIPQSSVSLAHDIAALLDDTSQTAPVALLVDLLRSTHGLRQWLRLAMLDSDMRHRFENFLDGKLAPPAAHASGRNLLAWVAGINGPLDETTRLRDAFASAAPTYGGLTRPQIFALIRRHQAGPLALAPFLLIAAWRKAATDKAALPAALLATEAFFNASFAGDAPKHFEQLAHAATFFQGVAPKSIDKTHYGHAKWWQLNILLYMLAHPKPSYRMREFTRHLETQKIRVDTADIRRFCRNHRIARDTRPGRPRRAARLN